MELVNLFSNAANDHKRSERLKMWNLKRCKGFKAREVNKLFCPGETQTRRFHQPTRGTYILAVNITNLN